MRPSRVQRALLAASFAAAIGLLSAPANAVVILDADTPATGSNLGTTTLLTPFGTISFVGEIRDRDGDPEFNAAGAFGNVFDIIDYPTSTALLTFGFDVASVRFIYGGNAGVFDIQARDVHGLVVDSFFQPDTDAGQPAGPITLSGGGIRSLYWEDPEFSFSAIDNLEIVPAEPVPEPTTLALLGVGLVAMHVRRRRIM